MASQIRRAGQDPKKDPQTAQALRALPSVDSCLRALAAAGIGAELSDSFLRAIVRQVLDSLRTGVLDSLRAGVGDAAASQAQDPTQPKGQAPTLERAALLARVKRAVAERIAVETAAWQPVVNATGVVIHTNLGRAPLAESAIDAIAVAARSAIDLEYDLARGARGDRDRLVESALCRLTGAEAATVVNNNAAAVLLALNTLAEGREVIVSRGELVEIGGSFRIPDVMAKSGARLREVGTTNRTHLDDYRAALGPDTALLLKVHPSNYRIQGFTASVALAELCALGREHQVSVMEDLGSGALLDPRALRLGPEPLVRGQVQAGAGLVTFSGDKLLGGPQAGIVVGRRELIERLKRNPLKRALRCDKLTLVALGATLEIYLRDRDPVRAIPVLRQLARTLEELEALGQRARDILSQCLGPAFEVELAPSSSEVGSGALPGEELPTRVLKVRHPQRSPDALAAYFRQARPPIIGRIVEGSFQLDLRTIEDPALLRAVFPAL